jgi:undecaprenyl-diphosphatase
MMPEFDADLLRLLNRPGARLLDAIMLGASSRFVLLPAALVLGVIAAFRSPYRWLVPVLLGAAIGVTDLVTVRVIKPFVERVRPCRAVEWVQAPAGCGPGQSFPSSHAAEAAAAAAVLLWASPPVGAFTVAGAILVGSSRVYLGVHYPTDVVAGWIVGAILGAAVVTLARIRYAVQTR